MLNNTIFSRDSWFGTGNDLEETAELDCVFARVIERKSENRSQLSFNLLRNLLLNIFICICICVYPDSADLSISFQTA